MQDNKGITSNCSIIILAAGMGTRMKSSIPKVLHKLCGKEMLFCVIDEVSLISDDIHIVLYNKSDSIIELLSNTYLNNKFNIHIQNYSNFPGTAGAIMKGYTSNPKELIDIKYNRVLILSADMPLINNNKLKKFINQDGNSVGVLEVCNSSGYGRVIIKDGMVKKIIEEKDANCEVKNINIVNAGIYCFDRELLNKYLNIVSDNNAQNEFYLTDIVELISKEIGGIEPIYGTECEFMGVNSKTELAKAEEIMLNKLRRDAMENGVILHIPNSIYIEFGTKFIGECEIDSGVTLKGKNTIIESHIKSNSVIEDSIIQNSIIGPFARIRPKSNIKNSNIGNFLEVKASKLYCVKAGHLSYIGDSEIDSGTNIGAGVITCNYNGKSKNKTIVGKNVFIGSGTQLIAPLNIESNAFIAAGSVISKDVKDGDLAISRAKQENKKGFFYKFFEKDNI